MRIVKRNWYGFDHAAVNKQFSGNLTFLNDFCVNGEYSPSAVYIAATPDFSKGHKKYLLLTKSNGKFYVRGMSDEEMEPFRYQDAIHCLACDDIIYSINRHDYNKCACGNVGIDGGRDYTKTTREINSPYKMVTIDLLSDEISDPKTNYGKEKETEETKAENTSSSAESTTQE
jgi:hypothetical protein